MNERMDKRADFLKRKEISQLLFPNSPEAFATAGAYHALGAACIINVRPGLWPSSRTKGVFPVPALARVHQQC